MFFENMGVNGIDWRN